jgi:hypothetical protein
MNSFANAVANQEARTANGMKARKSTTNACVDLFYKIGASRGKDIVPDFVAAMVESKDLALRIVQWARDARGGAGERQIFRDVLIFLEKNDPDSALKLIAKVPELGRWDDLLIFTDPVLKNAAFAFIGNALKAENGLCAKWMPRQGKVAVELRKFLGLSPKQYRKTLVNLTKVVEQQMCAKDWDNINFSHVPSVAAARYKKAFNRNTTKYAEYVQALVNGDVDVKVNAGAVFPYDVLKGMITRYVSYDKTETSLVEKQWEALENFVGDANILPMVDVSGSMTCPAGGYSSKSKLTCLEVAVSLGLYLSDKNTGAFKDIFATFSGSPTLENLKGTIVQKAQQMNTSSWGMNTDVIKCFQNILNVAKKGKVPQDEMPDILLILSDMQFDQCAKFDDSALESVKRLYAEAGYDVPKVVFWNLNASDNVPVKSNEKGVALVSGFSPAIVRAVLANDLDDFTPENIMLKTVMIERYDV